MKKTNANHTVEQLNQEIKKQNRAYTLPRLILLVVLVVFIMLRLVTIVNDNPGDLAPFVKYILIMLATAVVIILYPEFKYHRGFKKETTDYLIIFFNMVQNLGGSRTSGPMVYYKALVYIFYGEFNNAQACLSEVEWFTQVPIYQARKYNAEALIHYLKPGKYSEGLALAQKGRDLCGGNINLFNIINRRQMVFVNIGNMLTDQNINPETLNQLEKAFRFSSLLHKLIIAWALSYGHSISGNPEKSRKYSDYCKKRAPHCAPLHQMPRFSR